MCRFHCYLSWVYNMVTSTAVTNILVNAHRRRLKTGNIVEAGSGSDTSRGFNVCIYCKGEHNV
jgi:hypothetical protein